jgi:hypothetical protein
MSSKAKKDVDQQSWKKVGERLSNKMGLHIPNDCKTS